MCSPRFGGAFVLYVDAIILKKITNHSGYETNGLSWKHLENLKYADPAFASGKQQIDILLGAVEYAQIIRSGLIKGTINDPIAQNSELGWLISGPINAKTTTEAKITSLILITDLDQRVKEYFESNDLNDELVSNTSEEEVCEKHFEQNHERLENGRVTSSLCLFVTISHQCWVTQEG